MKKRIISLLLALVLAATLLPVQAWGATVVDSGYCGGEGDGKNLTWTLDSDGVLTISGEGKMGRWIDLSSVPWYTNRSKIKRVVVGSGVTSIGDSAFACSSLTSVSIGDSVTSIGEKAFSVCNRLTSVTIPDSVTSIDQLAFYGCSNLTGFQVDPQNRNYCSIDGVIFDKSKKTLVLYPSGNPASDYVIPSSVTSIGEKAFYHCSRNLANITIPNSVTSIGDSAFSGCSSLTSVIIPDSVTSIGDDAFSSCRSLTSVTISNSVTSIGKSVFANCRLANVTIPNSVTSIGTHAFLRCGYLTSVTIPGSVMSIEERAFADCTSLKDVYYTGSEKQWEAISIGKFNYPLTSSATIHYNSGATESQTIYNAATGELALTVYENKNTSDIRETDYQLSKGALVSSGSVNETTDKNGQISQSYSGGAVTVSKNGYVSRTISEAALKVNPTVWLQKESDTYPVISAVWMDDVNDIMNAEYFLPLVQDTSHTVRAEVNWGNSSMQSLKLTQGTTTLDISDSGNTSLTWSDKFDLSREILVVATNTEGKRTSKVLKIKSGNEGTKALDGLKLDFGDSLKFTLPDSVPVIGGDSMKLGLYSPVMVDYAVENGKIYVAIGLNADETTEKDDETGKKVTKVKTFADSVKKLKENRKKLKDLFRGKTKLKGSWGIDVGFHVAGYMEGYLDENNHIHWQDSGLIIGAEGGVNGTYQFAIGPVPAYAEAGLKAELEAQLALAVSESAKKLTPDGTVSGSIAVNIGLGLGVKKALSVGGGAEGEIGAEMQYQDLSVSSAAVTFSLAGYFKATFLGLEYKHDFDPWVEKVIYEYPDYTSNAAVYTLDGDDVTQEGDAALYAAVYNIDNYSQPDLSYLASGSPFLANGSGVMLQAARAVTVDSASTFQSNTYQNAAPQLLCLSDGTMMAVWTGYDSSRSGMNALCLYYARYDGSSWSEPAILDNDDTMDCGFTLREINGAPCVVWENASGAIESSDDLDAVAAKMSISVARYVDGAFVIERVSDAVGANTMPDVCAVGDGLSVVWVCNENGDLFANNGTNKIVCRTMTGEGWSEESVLYSGLNSVDSLAVGSSGDTLQVAYSMDTDGDLTTSADMEVYINGSAATSDSVIDSGVQYENGQFYWYKDGALMSGGNEMVPAASNLRSDRYQVVESSGVKAVLFTQSNGVYSSLYGIFCDTTSGTWGEPVALTDGSDYIQAFSATPSANGLQVMVNRLAVTGDGSTGDPYGEARMDILDLTLGCDLAVKDVYCDMQYYVAGNKLPVTVTVANKGRQAVSQVKVTFLAENGTELGTETLDISLPAGVTQEIETGFTVKDVVQG